jgi:PAS domain S-box-containing protein
LDVKCRLRGPGGIWRWTNVRAAPIKDDHGAIIKWVGMSTEIGESKQIEAALDEREKRYHQLFKEDLMGHFLCTCEGRILLCNAAFADIFGFPSVDAAVGASVMELYLDPGEHALILASLRAQGKLANNEARRKRRDGTPIHVVENLVGHFNNKGELCEIHGYVFDDTGRKHAEETLREAKDDLERKVEELTAKLQQTNERLREEKQKRIRTEHSLGLEEARLDALFQLSRMDTASLKEITDFTLELAIRLTHSKIGFLGFLNANESVYTLHAVSKDVVKECNVTENPLEWHVVDAGIWAEAIRGRRTLFVNDYSQPHPRKKGLPAGHPPVERFMVVPILEDGRIVAVAGVGNKASDYEKSDERQVVLLLTGMWGYVKRNRSSEELRRAHDGLEERVKRRTAELAESAAALQTSQKDLSRAQEVGQMGNWRMNVHHNILSWSDEAHHIFGVPKGTPLTYETFLEIVHPDDRRTVDRRWKAALCGEPYDLEHRIVVDGRVKWVREKAYLEFDEEGKPREGFGITQDVTDRKRAEEALRQQARLLHLSYDAIIVWRRDGAIEHWNRGAEQLYGFTEGEALGRVTHELLKTIHPVPYLEVEAAMRKHGQWEGELRHYAKDGHEVIVSARHQLVLGTDGIERILETNRDVTDRKRAEEALRESERRFQQLFEEDLTGDFLCTHEGRILLCNMAFADIFGFSSINAAAGRSMLELYIDPGERDSILATLRAQRKLAYYETWRKRRDGTPVHIVENLVGHFNDQGELYEIQGYVFDDTERKRAEEAVRQSERHWRDLAEALPQLVWTCNPDGRCNFLSQQWITYTGRSEAEQLDYGWLDQVHPDDRDRLTTAWDEAVASGTLFDVEFRIRRADGVYRWFKTRAVPVRNADGQVAEWFGSNTDIEDLKCTTEALRKSEENYRNIVETATEAIVIVDAEARIVFVNDRWSEMFGYSREEALHMTHFDLLFPEDAAEMEVQWESRKDGRKQTYEFRLRRKDGSPVWVLVGVAPNFGLEGEFLGTLNMLADITERKLAEEALRELNAALESKVAQRTEELERRARLLQKLTLELTEAEERERKNLAEILHDDLQQVLVATKFQVESMTNRVSKDTELRETAEQARELLIVAIDKSRSLSHELSSPALAQEDLGVAFEWLAQQMQRKHGLTVDLEIGDRIEVASEPHRFLLYKVAQELLFNVIKHAGVREAVLHLRRRRGLIRLAVSDRGRGFDAVGSSHAFGLGLPSIRERVECLGGRLKIRSAPGKGSTFIVAVPDAERSPHARSTGGRTGTRP